jgi:uncharacterized repeat protein (TIGR01451 family)
MGNGRLSGKGSGMGWLRVSALGAVFVLMLTGLVLLGLGSRSNAQKALGAAPISPDSTSPRSSLARTPLTRTSLKPEARALLGQLPLIFEPNQGQADSRVKFLARGAGYSLFLDGTSAMLATQTTRSSSGRSERYVRMKLVGANPAAVTEGADPLPGKSNYMIGNDQRKWRSGIQQFAGVHYASVYPGIDLIFYGNQGSLEYDFQVAPGADPAQAELEFTGANKLELSGGDLVLTGKEDGGLRLRAPQIYQRDGDRREPVGGRFALRAGNRVGFEIGPYDHRRELIIDPQLSFSTYFGGSGSETSPSVAVNGDGFIYVVGSTTSPAASFPLSGTVPTQIGTAPNIFVAKINPSQPPSVIYATFLGGSGGPGADTSIGIGVDNSGNTYVVGNTSSTDYPTFGIPYQTGPETKTQCGASPTCTSVFVTVLNPTGSAPPVYSSYVSGNGDDQASGMTIDTKGDVFITGTTTSNQEPTTDAFPATQVPVPFQSVPAPGSTIQFFATKVNTTVISTGGIAYSTYFGGANGTIATGGGIAVDTTGNMYFSGTTNFFNGGSGAFGNSGTSEDFPILNAYQPCLDTPPPVVLVNPTTCVAPASPVPTDAFVAKINPLGPTGLQLLFSTFLGGTGTDSSTGIAIDTGALNIYLTGETNSGDFIIPTGVAPFQLCLDTPVNPTPPATCPVIAPTAPFDAYVARMSNPTLSTTGVPNDVALTYFSYLGGSGNDSGAAVAVLDSSSTTLDDVVITGATSSTDFPVTLTNHPIQSTLLGATNAFVAQIDTTTVVANNQAGSFVTYFGGNGVDHGTGIAVDPSLNTYFVGDTTSATGSLTLKNPLPGAGGTTLNGPSDAFIVELGTATDLCITCVAPVVNLPAGSGELSAGNQVTITFTVTNNGPDPATNIAVNGTVPSASEETFNSATASSGTCSAPSGNAVVCQIPTLQAGAAATVAFVVTPTTACTSCSVTAQVFSSNNTSTTNTATASFVAGGFNLQVNPSSQTVSAGNIAQYAVVLSPDPVFGANISLSCSALPAGATCSFSNSTIALNQGSGSSQLNLSTTAQPVVTISSVSWIRPLYAFWLMVPGMALMGVGASGKRRGKKARLLGLLALSVLFAMVLLQPACSSTKTQPTVSGTPSGTYSLTITATSGSYTKSVPFSLTVEP